VRHLPSNGEGNGIGSTRQRWVHHRQPWCLMKDERRSARALQSRERKRHFVDDLIRKTTNLVCENRKIARLLDSKGIDVFAAQLEKTTQAARALAHEHVQQQAQESDELEAIVSLAALPQSVPAMPVSGTVPAGLGPGTASDVAVAAWAQNLLLSSGRAAPSVPAAVVNSAARVLLKRRLGSASGVGVGGGTGGGAVKPSGFGSAAAASSGTAGAGGRGSGPPALAGPQK
jgi:hypothetical protein